MIPQADIVAWRQAAPWAEDAMVEQDLALSRVLVEIFSHEKLAEGLAMRGGTALHKLVLLPASRYSEDIDLVQVQPGAIGSFLDPIRARLNPWLGEPTRDQAESTVTMLSRFASEVPPVRPLRLKVEIHTREHFAVYGHIGRPLAVASRWFTGQADSGHFSWTNCSPPSSVRSFSVGGGAISSTCGTPPSERRSIRSV